MIQVQLEKQKEFKIREIQQGKLYRHFKGKLYKVICIATHSEIKEKLVVYQTVYEDGRYFARSYEMLALLIDKEKYPDVAQHYRFEHCDEC